MVVEAKNFQEYMDMIKAKIAELELPRETSVSEPCLGLAGLHKLLKNSKIELKEVNVYEMEVKFTCYYRNRFGETVLQTFHIGQERGILHRPTLMTTKTAMATALVHHAHRGRATATSLA